jgi:hypothetical protein
LLVAKNVYRRKDPWKNRKIQGTKTPTNNQRPLLRWSIVFKMRFLEWNREEEKGRQGRQVNGHQQRREERTEGKKVESKAF